MVEHGWTTVTKLNHTFLLWLAGPIPLRPSNTVGAETYATVMYTHATSGAEVGEKSPGLAENGR